MPSEQAPVAILKDTFLKRKYLYDWFALTNVHNGKANRPVAIAVRLKKRGFKGAIAASARSAVEINPAPNLIGRLSEQ